MKKTIFGAMVSMVCALVLVTGCGSTKNGVKINPDDTDVVDWTNRTVNGPRSPKWFEDLGKDDYATFRKEFGIDKSYKVLHFDAKGKTEDSAKVASRLDATARIAESVKADVLSKAENTLDNKTISALRKVDADVTVNGLELITQFWQATVTYNPETDSKTKEYRCWSFYKIPEKNWKEAQVGYAKKILNTVSDPAVQSAITGIVSNLESVTR